MAVLFRASDDDVSARRPGASPARRAASHRWSLTDDRVAPRLPDERLDRARRHGGPDLVGSRRGGSQAERGQARETQEPHLENPTDGCGAPPGGARARGSRRSAASAGNRREPRTRTAGTRPTATRAGASGTPTAVSAYVSAASTPPTPPSGSGRIIAACPAANASTSSGSGTVSPTERSDAHRHARVPDPVEHGRARAFGAPPDRDERGAHPGRRGDRVRRARDARMTRPSASTARRGRAVSTTHRDHGERRHDDEPWQCECRRRRHPTHRSTVTRAAIHAPIPKAT